jgi:arylsulfatase A-like enzyme
MRWPSILAIVPLAALAACGGGSTPVTPPTPTPTPTPDLGPPNVVIILADDLGYGDLGSFGNAKIKTPNIDRLATEGVKLTSFYVPVPICAPSRAGLMTGRWPYRTGIPWNPPVKLNDDEITIADALRGRGYATGMVGKWHLGWTAPDFPTHHGFDYYYGIPAGEDESDFILGDQPTRDGVTPDMLSRRYTDAAITWIKGVPKGRPFFLYLAHRDPHLPNSMSAPFLGQSAGGLYGDVIEALDSTVGQLMQALKDIGADQNTLVLFTSDNGPVIPPQGPGSAGPLYGAKGSCQEGGIRVPALARWPARIPPGRTITEPVSTMDLFPTVLSLAGGTLPTDRKYDGMDVGKLLTGESNRLSGPGIDGGREIVFWYERNPVAIRSGKWKWLRTGFWSPIPSLYDLEADPGEAHDLRQTRPELAQQLDARIDQLVFGGS